MVWQERMLTGERELQDGSVERGSWVRGKRIGVGSSGEVFLIEDARGGDVRGGWGGDTLLYQ